jgi:hypothetical protein
MMKSMGVPATFWGEAVKTAVRIINRSPTRSLKGVTPYEAWRRKKPKVDYFRTFGCVAYYKVVGPGLTKLSDRAHVGVFVGYEDGAKAYRVFDPIGNRLHTRIWLPVGKSGYRPVTGNPEHPRETEMPNKKIRAFLNFLNFNVVI